MTGTSSLTCVSCGAPITLSAGGTVCQHCGSFQIVTVETDTVAPQEMRSSGDDFAHEGIRAFNRGEYRLAIQQLCKATGLGVQAYDLAQLYTIIGNGYDKLGSPDKSIRFHQLALETDPHYYKAWVGKGIAYRKKGDFAEAQRCYQRALEIEPDYAELYASLGALEIFRGDAFKAIDWLEKAISLDPSVAVAHANIALAFAMVGDFGKAEAALRQSVALGYANHQSVKQRIADLKALE